MSEAHAHQKKNPAAWLLQYFRESAEEIRKVSWPSKQDTFKYSVIVVGLCVILAVFFAGLDWVLALGIQKLIEIKK
ncbi:preprotein translocase subunit SecE [Candidatus Uhrbacteria bacterium RIFCSPHIGHO2_02_FULL_47_44]|uniref:Protein translocase subunit SecE n=1 Tax=Candidatus Uhrbacteria bacterium RIFCSPLOWO2_02_FULL_48_18 TaxID=1802408 RepID=A0A1F7V8S3_9BACT|nr:MAG: preprotein translocase subunit SecE [Candidatus Uhrbacteria bacterium RIFCSPHIGHO2_01_FULL_47_10]OGL70810.1 MAG: preprotein translocase subunit SecE [Candidatus Uhrbacteria bacterium RIFCSPHIGHO2_02_FULL_47_44]OGL77632.1 MAG: preprotein translocase subunit SecE [Candidatus Uhrbacteria bacterium RIFCSPHIGHO2_12_FULL_47_12]OGL82533.1 MAG: preprotein translocase subunit SecE [Candidatus Uhrbacteria bacterium RIFCSPLOWO2_01_FULL_47_17]OGL86916.1 MAG: preprotein translocase subunit SecE [Can